MIQLHASAPRRLTASGVKILSLVLLLFGYGCSYRTEFVFMNGTSAPARVSYVFRDPAVGWQSPALGDRPKGPFQVLTQSRYTVSSDRARVAVVVPPGRALRLFTLANYPGNDLRGLAEFPLSELTVADDRSAVALQDERALLAFQRWNDRLYVFPAYEVVLEESAGRP